MMQQQSNVSDFTELLRIRKSIYRSELKMIAHAKARVISD